MTARPFLVIALASMLGVSAAHAQRLGSGEPVELPLLRLMIGLVVCIGLAFAAAYFLKRRSGGELPFSGLLKMRVPISGAGAGIRILETRRLSTHADLCRFQSGGVEYLVIVSQGAATIVRETPAAPSTATGDGASNP